jgi:dTDP-4-dehydrorhamnose reductase
VSAALDRHEPWLVVNTAGYVRVDDAEQDSERCLRENAIGPATLARACARHEVPLISFSSDLVFDGRKQAPYDEHDTPSPLCVYGRSKLEAEERILDAHPESLVVRTSAFFGPWDEHRALAEGREVRAADDTIVSPTYVPDLVHACLDLAIDSEQGLWHLANQGTATWAELARKAARLGGHAPSRITSVPSSELAWRAPRPPFSALGSARGLLLPSLDDALLRYQGARAQEQRSPRP